MVEQRAGIKDAGREYRQLLQGRGHVIIFGGRANLWGIDPLYETLAKQSVEDLKTLGLNVIWGGSLMDDWISDDFINWHWKSDRRYRAE